MKYLVSKLIGSDKVNYYCKPLIVCSSIVKAEQFLSWYCSKKEYMDDNIKFSVDEVNTYDDMSLSDFVDLIHSCIYFENAKGAFYLKLYSELDPKWI